MARAAAVIAWPPGLVYRPAVVSLDEERALIEAIAFFDLPAARYSVTFRTVREPDRRRVPARVA